MTESKQFDKIKHNFPHWPFKQTSKPASTMTIKEPIFSFKVPGTNTDRFHPKDFPNSCHIPPVINADMHDDLFCAVTGVLISPGGTCSNSWASAQRWLQNKRQSYHCWQAQKAAKQQQGGVTGSNRASDYVDPELWKILEIWTVAIQGANFHPSKQKSKLIL